MSDKRRLGHNQNPIEEAAIRLIKSLIKNLIDYSVMTNEAVLGKNKTIRDIAAMDSAVAVESLLKRLKPWADIIEAKENGEDIHSYPYKSKKLDIVSEAEHDFGQFIIDKENNNVH